MRSACPQAEMQVGFVLLVTKTLRPSCERKGRNSGFPKAFVQHSALPPALRAKVEQEMEKLTIVKRSLAAVVVNDGCSVYAACLVYTSACLL